MKRALALSALILSLGSASLAQTITSAPSLLNFQGRLAKPDGTPVPDPVAPFSLTLRFSIWDAQTGGTERWNQTFAGVAVKNGVFSVLLNLGANAQTILNGNAWLEMKVGGDAPTPRQPLVSVAYAQKANTVPDNAITTSKIADGSVTAAKLANGVGGFSLPYSGSVALPQNNALLVINTAKSEATGGTGIRGEGKFGVVGDSPFIGVQGQGGSVGVYGLGNTGAGVVGESTSSFGVRGISTGTYGVYGTSTNDDGVHGVSVHGAGIYGTSINFYAGYFDGTVLATRGFYDSSDARYKTNINPLENPLATILNMRGVTYDWKRDDFKDMHFGPGRQIGFIAQELEKVLPELVHTDSKGYKSVNYSHVVPVLVEAVKTLKKDNDGKQKQIDELRTQVNALVEAVRQLQEPRK